MEFLGGGRIRQCEQVNVAFNHTICCVEDGVLDHGVCDQQWFPEFEKWGFDFDFRSHQPLDWVELTTEINEGRPFMFSWRVSATVDINHMMLVIGYDDSRGENMVIFLDPLYATEADAVMASFSDYNGTSRDHPHRDDYFRIRPIAFP